MTISVCIATCRRPARLRALLDDLTCQRLVPDEVIVVDNDAAGGARDVVAARRMAGAPFTLLYEIQPVPNIAITRNRTVSLAQGEWLAFIDDDERAPPHWLGELHARVTASHADGALGPVEPRLPADAPPWIRRGDFYSWAHLPSGTIVPRNKLRFGNLILRGALLRATPHPFDPSFGVTGGEDGDLLGRLAGDGAHFVWCEEAYVDEPIEARRMSLRWLLLRAMRGGQDFARHRLHGRYGPVTAAVRAWFLLRSLAQAVASATLMVAVLPLGRHRAAFWACRLAGNLGKLSGYFGARYHEYGSAPPSTP